MVHAFGDDQLLVLAVVIAVTAARGIPSMKPGAVNENEQASDDDQKATKRSYLKKHPVVYEDAPAHYNYEYGVHDVYYGNNFDAQESSDGKVTQGVYRVLLPDGRIQTVTYYDNGYGFHADVEYEGEAKYPEYTKPHKPYHGIKPKEHYAPVASYAPKVTYTPKTSYASEIDDYSDAMGYDNVEEESDGYYNEDRKLPTAQEKTKKAALPGLAAHKRIVRDISRQLATSSA